MSTLSVRRLMVASATLRFVLVYNLTRAMIAQAVTDIRRALQAGALTPLPEQPDAIAFAQVKRGDMKFSGFAREDGIIRSVRQHKTDWKNQIADWRAALEDLAVEFRTGRAAANPKRKDTCETDRCPLAALCRIKEERS